MYQNTKKSTGLKDLLLLYYSIIKDQFYSKYRTYVLIYIFKEYLEDINQLVTVCPLSSDFCHLTMVEVNGIEPMASCVQGRRSPS